MSTSGTEAEAMGGLTLIFIYATGAGCLALFGYAICSLFVMSRYSSYEERAVQSLGVGLDQLHIYIDPGRLYHLSVLVTALFFLFGFAIGGGDLGMGLFFGVLLGAIGAGLPRLVIAALARRRLEKLNRQLPTGLDMLSSSLRAGLSLHQAITRNLDSMPSIMGEELRVVAHECRLGQSLVDALRHWADRVGLLDVRVIAIAAEISLRRGGNLTDTFDTLAHLIRAKYVFKKEIQTLTSEGRMQALVMTALPFVMLIVMTLIKRQMMMEFILSTAGMFLLTLVLVMQIVAYVWIRKLITIES